MVKAKEKKSIKLPSCVFPNRYNLTLKPDLEAFTFSGNETIEIEINKDINEITLHSKDIDIQTVKIASPLSPLRSTREGKSSFASIRELKGDEANFVDKISYNTKAETVTFTFKKKIKKGKAKLNIVFSGIISESLRGFYRSRYEIDGVEKHLATTQFEATDARRAFPCFDEPAHKAIFDVSLIIPGTHTAISNTMPIDIKEHEAGYKIVSFEPTPKMSTYLLAFIIGEFEYVEGRTKPGSKFSRSGLPEAKPAGQEIRGPENLLPGGERTSTQVRVFTTHGKKHQAKFALDVAIRCLEFYNKYFDIPYPLPTLDLIAIPDFESAAMENWGAVTFRETAILVDEENTSLSNKQWVAIVIAHELAHQWFGNLVTMEWWTDLWLNEGFASYMENLCTDHLFPEWHVWDLYIADRYAVALRLDALANSHPIEVTVHHPDEISEIFDMVSYAKGSAVIRMLAEYLGHDTFRDGLRHYLKKHSYKNTETINLWESFEQVSKKKIVQMMDTWTKQTGYPLVTLSKNKHEYFAHQERFFSSRVSKKLNEKTNKKNKSKQLWHIPLSYQTNNETLKTITTKNKIPLIGASIGKINLGEKSFIRTHYDKETIDILKIEIENKKLATIDRLGLIRDMFALAEAGYISTTVALDFSLAYKNETEYIVWAELASGINKVYAIFGEEKYKKYALSLFSPLAKRMTWNHIENENHSQTFLRSLALSNAGSYGDTEVVKYAQKLFNGRMKKQIHADIRSTVYSIVAQNGGQKEWDLFKKLYKNETLHEEKERYGRALTQFRNKKLLENTLSFALSKNVRDQDTPFLIGAVWSNTYGRDITWKFIKKNYKEILKRFGVGGHFLSRLLTPLGGHITKKDYGDIKKFFKNNPAPGSTRTLEQALERISSNIAWISADKASVKKWLKQNF